MGSSRKFDIQFFAEPEGTPAASPVELEEEVSAEAYGKLDETFRRAYKPVQGKEGVYSLNRKGKDTLTETLNKERDARKAAEKMVADLGMPVEDAKKLLAEYAAKKKENQTEAERMQDAIAKAHLENEATKKQLEAMQADLEASKLESTRLRVQGELKIPGALMKFLTGGTYDELKAAGAELMQHVKPSDPSQVAVGGGIPPSGGVPLDEQKIKQEADAGREKAKKFNESHAVKDSGRLAF